VEPNAQKSENVESTEKNQGQGAGGIEGKRITRISNDRYHIRKQNGDQKESLPKGTRTAGRNHGIFILRGTKRNRGLKIREESGMAQHAGIGLKGRQLRERSLNTIMSLQVQLVNISKQNVESVHPAVVKTGSKAFLLFTALLGNVCRNSGIERKPMYVSGNRCMGRKTSERNTGDGQGKAHLENIFGLANAGKNSTSSGPGGVKTNTRKHH